MTRINPAWLNAAPTRKVLAALDAAAPLFVGGCVRDALMGRDAHDVDIAVAVEPAQVMAMLQDAGLRALPIGIEHGVVAALADDATIEIATLRRDVETDGRRAVIAFTDNIAEDAMRRDFTVNALYARPDGQVLDPTGEGLADLRRERLRFIGDAETRIKEDYLRILRFYRFSAQFHRSDFDPSAQAACYKLAEGLARISKERIGAEMVKLLSAQDPDAVLAAMGPVLPQIVPSGRHAPGLANVELQLNLSPCAMRRLATFGSDPAELAEALRLPRNDLARLVEIKRACSVPLPEAAYRYGLAVAGDALALNVLNGDQPPKDWLAVAANASRAHFPIRGGDLIALGLPAGPGVGAALKSAEAAWIASGFTLEREDLLSQAMRR